MKKNKQGKGDRETNGKDFLPRKKHSEFGGFFPSNLPKRKESTHPYNDLYTNVYSIFIYES